MHINFVTSGFPNGFTDEFVRELKKYLSSDLHFAFVASDFSVHEKTDRYLRLFLKLFEEKGICFGKSTIVDYEIAPTDAIHIIDNADVVWLAGGPTLTQIHHIKEYGLINALQKREGITIGMSAGSINMAKRVVLAKDLHDNVLELSIYDGIGLVDFNIEPHLDFGDKEHIADIVLASKVSPIYGLYDESFILDIDGNYSVFGEYHLFES